MVLKHFLVVYDRRAGLVQVKAYQRADKALSARFAAERTHRDEPDVEVVVLGAESEAALARTHSRYFKSVPELAEAALGKLSPA